MMNALVEALRSVGFEVRSLIGQPDTESSSVLKGESPVEPVFGFVGAFKLTDVVHLGGARKEGKFLVCLEPGTGNLEQVFDLADGGRFLGR